MPQMQIELLRGGPGVVSFVVYDDFQAYSSGTVLSEGREADLLYINIK